MAKKYDDEEGIWRTIGGRRIFIKNGESLVDAMKRSGKFETGRKALGRSLKDLGKEELNGEGVKKLFETNDDTLSKMTEQELKDELYDNDRILNEVERRLSGKYELTDSEKDKLEERASRYESKKDEIKSELSRRKALGKGLNDLGKEKIDGEGVQKLFENEDKDDDGFTMYNSKYDKEVKIWKGPDGKWHDSDGNKYMGYLSKSDVKSYFKGEWGEQKSTGTVDQIINKQMSDTRNAQDQIAGVLGIKTEDDARYKSISQLYREQKGKDLAETAINSKRANKYYEYVEKNHKYGDKDWTDRADIDKYAKENKLDSDSLYYMTKLASESDRRKLMKSAETLKDGGKISMNAYNKYKKEHPESKMTFEDFKKRLK